MQIVQWLLPQYFGLVAQHPSDYNIVIDLCIQFKIQLHNPRAKGAMCMKINGQKYVEKMQNGKGQRKSQSDNKLKKKQKSSITLGYKFQSRPTHRESRSKSKQKHTSFEDVVLKFKKLFDNKTKLLREEPNLTDRDRIKKYEADGANWKEKLKKADSYSNLSKGKQMSKKQDLSELISNIESKLNLRKRKELPTEQTWRDPSGSQNNFHTSPPLFSYNIRQDRQKSNQKLNRSKSKLQRVPTEQTQTQPKSYSKISKAVKREKQKQQQSADIRKKKLNDLRGSNSNQDKKRTPKIKTIDTKQIKKKEIAIKHNKIKQGENERQKVSVKKGLKQKQTGKKNDDKEIKKKKKKLVTEQWENDLLRKDKLSSRNAFQYKQGWEKPLKERVEVDDFIRGGQTLQFSNNIHCKVSSSSSESSQSQFSNQQKCVEQEHDNQLQFRENRAVESVIWYEVSQEQGLKFTTRQVESESGSEKGVCELCSNQAVSQTLNNNNSYVKCIGRYLVGFKQYLTFQQKRLHVRQIRSPKLAQSKDKEGGENLAAEDQKMIWRIENALKEQQSKWLKLKTSLQKIRGCENFSQELEKIINEAEQNHLALKSMQIKQSCKIKQEQPAPKGCTKRQNQEIGSRGKSKLSYEQAPLQVKKIVGKGVGKQEKQEIKQGKRAWQENLGLGSLIQAKSVNQISDCSEGWKKMERRVKIFEQLKSPKTNEKVREKRGWGDKSVNISLRYNSETIHSLPKQYRSEGHLHFAGGEQPGRGEGSCRQLILKNNPAISIRAQKVEQTFSKGIQQKGTKQNGRNQQKSVLGNVAEEDGLSQQSIKVEQSIENAEKTQQLMKGNAVQSGGPLGNRPNNQRERCSGEVWQLLLAEFLQELLVSMPSPSMSYCQLGRAGKIVVKFLNNTSVDIVHEQSVDNVQQFSMSPYYQIAHDPVGAAGLESLEIESTIKTDRGFIMKLTESLLQFIQVNFDRYSEFKKRLSKPLGVDTLALLRILRDNEVGIGSQEDSAIEAGLQGELDRCFDNEFNQQEMEQYYIVSLDTLTQFQYSHFPGEVNIDQQFFNQAIYDKVNMILDNLRPYGTKGIPVLNFLHRYKNQDSSTGRVSYDIPPNLSDVKLARSKTLEQVRQYVAEEMDNSLRIRLGHLSFDIESEKVIQYSFQKFVAEYAMEMDEQWRTFNDGDFEVKHSIMLGLEKTIFMQQVELLTEIFAKRNQSSQLQL